MRKIIVPALTILALIIATIAIILYGRGFRPDPDELNLATTGLLNASSDPDGAQVIVNGDLKTATDSTLNLAPGNYKIKITKEGYLPWEKEFEIAAEVVAEANAFLFPANPSLSPLTTTGVENPTVAPDYTSIAFIKRNPEATSSAVARERETLLQQTGIFLLELEDRPLSFSRNPRQILSYADLPITHYSLPITLIWSPEGDQLLALFGNEGTTRTAYLLNKNSSNQPPQQIPDVTETVSLWQEQQELKEQSILASLPRKFIPVATASSEIIGLSPDETKVLYQATESIEIPEKIIDPPLIGTNPTPETRELEPGNIYVYDIKEDRNYFLEPATEFTMPSEKSESLNNEKLSAAESSLITDYRLPITDYRLQWFPTSRHLLFIREGQIKVVEYDGSNETTIYAGPFKEDFVIPWPNGSKLVILTSLNPDAARTLNLYAVKLH